MWWHEVIGTIASLFIVFAFICRGETKIRIIDSIGAFIFIVYGILIHSFSVAFLNTITFGINIYYLIHDKKQ